MTKPYLVAVLILSVGIVLSTAMYRVSQTTQPPKDFLQFCGTADSCFTELPKKLVETQDGLSKWLLGLAYSTLGGMLLLRVKNWRSTQITSYLPICACALLVVSLFGAFLFQVGIIFTLSRGPLYHLSTGVVWVPLLTQFWGLVIALALLATWLFGPRRSLQLGFVISLALAASRPMSAAGAAECSALWQQTRGIDKSDKLAGLDSKYLGLLAERAHKQLPSTCQFADTVLDRVRYAATQVKGTRSLDALISYTESLVDDAAQNSLSADELTTEFIKALSFWQAPSGLFVLAAAKIHDVGVDATRCLTPCSVRVQPGSYKIQASLGGKIDYLCTLTIKDSDVVKVQVDQDKCH